MRFEHAHIRQLKSLAVFHAFSVWAGLHGSIIPNRATVIFEIAPVRICGIMCLKISYSFFKMKISRVIGNIIARLVLSPRISLLFCRTLGARCLSPVSTERQCCENNWGDVGIVPMLAFILNPGIPKIDSAFALLFST